MATTMIEVVAELMSDEPEYEAAARALGEEAAPFLLEIVVDESDRVLLKSKAIYLASLLSGPIAEDVLRRGAFSRWPEVRVAVSSGLKNASEASGRELFPVLLEDGDAGVRKVALQTIAAKHALYTKRKVSELATSDPKKFIRDLASEVDESLSE